MFGWLEKIRSEIKNLNLSITSYQKDTVIQSLPTIAYVNKAKKYIDKKQLDEAERLLHRALDISEQDALVYKYLGKIRERKNDFENAIKYYDKSAKLNANDKEIWLRLGMCQLNTKLLDEAIISFEKANKVSPMNTDVYTGWGMTLMRLKKYKNAKDKFVMATKINKYNYTAILLSAVMEVRLGEYEPAEMKLAFLTKIAPNESSTYEYANLMLVKSNYQEAELYANKSININPQMLPSYFILGEIYSTQKDIAKTEKVFRTAISNDLENSTLHFEWGKAYMRLLEFEKAHEQFAVALQEEPNFMEAKIGIALTSAYNGDFSILDEIEEKYSENVYVQEAMGFEKYSKGEYAESIDLFKKALKFDPQEYYNVLNIARAYRQLGDKTKTKEYFEKFTTENPQYLPALVEYSKWLMSLEDYADAQRKLRKAEKINEKNVEVLNLLFYCAYKLVKDNVCEYNIKEAISVANKIKNLGSFEYENEEKELEAILDNLQGNN